MRDGFGASVVAVLLSLVAAGCGPATPAATTTSPPSALAATSAPVTPATSAPTPVVTTRLEVSVGTPPPEGWRWVVAEYNTGADEVKEAASQHGFFWIFFVLKGQTEVTTSAGAKLANAGEGIMIAAREQHSHRYPPQSRVLIFDVRSANDNPDAFHRGTRVFLSEKIDLKPAPDFKLRVREFTIAQGGANVFGPVEGSNFVYVPDGTLTATATSGGAAVSVEGGKALPLSVGSSYVLRNPGTAPLRVLAVDVHP